MRKLILTCVTILFTILTTNLFAQISPENSSQLSIQGVLRNANGTAVENGQYDIVFRLWNAPTNGTKVWEEEKIGVDVEGGIYSVILGDGDTKLTAKFTEQYYLGVSVEGGTELIPRAALTSSPYALSLIGNDNIFPNSGNVGVGADEPQHKLTVQRKDAILGLEADSNVVNTATIKTIADGLQFNGGGTDRNYIFSEGRITFSKSGAISTIGYDENNGDNLFIYNPTSNLTLNVPNGETSILGNKIKLSPNHPVEIDKNVESLRLVGTDHTYMAFFPFGESAGKKAFIGYPNANNSDLTIENSAANGDLILKAAGGKILMNSGLQIEGHISTTLGWYTAQNYGENNNYTGNHGGNGYYASIIGGNFKGTQFVVTSDARIKKNLKQSDAVSDLSTLNQIEVTDYQHIDEVNQGIAFRKGLIAQQVDEVFPEAISKSKGFIPNIYSMSSKVVSNNEAYIITLHQPHELVSGDVVKIIAESGDHQLKVTNIVDNKTFSIESKDCKIEDEVFVYGKEVDDFHTVDYDRVFTLNVSATQELARKVEALEKENAQLKNNQTRTNDLLKSLSAKVESLQQNLEMTGQK